MNRPRRLFNSLVEAIRAAAFDGGWFFSLFAGSELRNPCMADRTPYQDRIIRNYYQNLDAILVQRLGELVTDLYLAEGQKRVRLWKRVDEAMDKLKVPPQRRKHIVENGDPALVAQLLKELLDKLR